MVTSCCPVICTFNYQYVVRDRQKNSALNLPVAVIRSFAHTSTLVVGARLYNFRPHRILHVSPGLHSIQNIYLGRAQTWPLIRPPRVTLEFVSREQYARLSKIIVDKVDIMQSLDSSSKLADEVLVLVCLSFLALLLTVDVQRSISDRNRVSGITWSA